MVQIQNWLNQIITEKVATVNNVDIPQFLYGIYAMPTAGYLTDEFYQILSGLLPFMMILAFIYPYFVISGAVVQEKANKIKEGLQMMGASITSYWLSTYLYYALKFIIIAFLCTLISYGTNVFKFSEFSVIFVWFTLFLFTLETSAIMFSTFFDNPKTASMVSSIFLLTLYFMYAAGDSMTTESQKTWLCLSGPACFAMSANNFGKFEEGLIGIRWDNINERYLYLGFSTALWMMFLDCIIYIILALRNIYYIGTNNKFVCKFNVQNVFRSCCIPNMDNIYTIFYISIKFLVSKSNYKTHKQGHAEIKSEDKPILLSRKYEQQVW